MRYFLIAIVALMFGMGTVACDKKKDAPAAKKAGDKKADDKKADGKKGAPTTP